MRFAKERRAYPAICLASDGGLLTAAGNDYGFDEIFARQVAALGQPGDVLRAPTGFRNERDDIGERLPRLSDEISAFEPLLGVPADLAGEKDRAPLRDHSIAEALARPPAMGMKKCVRVRHLCAPHVSL